MAINRYDTPAQAQFINTYVPIPFDQMMKVGMMKQQLVERNDESAAKLAADLGSFQAAPFDQKGLEKVSAEYKDKLNTLMNNAEPGKYEVTRGLMSLRAQMSADPRLKDISYNFGQYGQHIKNSEQAKEANAEGANSYGMDYALQDITNKGGAVGLIEKGQSGKWTPGGWSKPIDTYESIQQYVNDVDASSIEREGDTGKWILNKKESGRQLSTLVDQFGLAFEQIPAKGGKGIAYKSVIKNPSEFQYNLINKDWGRQYLKNARYMLGKDPNSMDKEVIALATEEAKGEMIKAAKERVMNNSSETIQIDPEWMADYNDQLKDKVTQLTWPQAVVLQGTGIPNLTELQVSTQAASLGVEQASTAYNSVKQKVKETLEIKDKDGNVIGYEYRDQFGADISDEMTKAQASVELNTQKLKDFENLQKRTKQQAADNLGIPVDAKPTLKVRQKALEEAARSAAKMITPDMGVTQTEDTILKMATKGLGPGELNYDVLEKLPENVRDEFIRKYEDTLNSNDPLFKETNRLLLEASKDQAITIGLSNFSSDRSNKSMESGFRLFGGNNIGLKNAYDDSPITPKSDEGKTIADNKDKFVYKGWSPNVNTGEIDVYYQADITKKGGKLGNTKHIEVKMPAPDGFVNLLLTENKTNIAELYVGSKLTRASVGVDGRGEIVLKDKNNNDYKVDIVVLTEEEKKNYVGSPDVMLQYKELSRADGLPGETKKLFGTRQEAISEILNLGNQINAK